MVLLRIAGLIVGGVSSLSAREMVVWVRWVKAVMNHCSPKVLRTVSFRFGVWLALLGPFWRFLPRGMSGGAFSISLELWKSWIGY